MNDITELEAKIIEGLRSGKPMVGKDGVLTPLVQRAAQAALEGEIESYLGEEGSKSNRRNGYTKKRVKSASGSFDLATPRDREGGFEPQLIKKRQTVLAEGLDNAILGLYALGNSYSGIKEHMIDTYGVEVSNATINAVTDKLLPEIGEWRSRPLETVYPVVFLDAIHFKAREDGRVTTKAIYSVMGIDQTGHKDILGLYIADSEGANFWAGVLTDLKNRGVEDILIACIDGLKGFPEAIESIFPKTSIQLCVVHQIRNSLKYVSSKYQKEFMKDLKPVYQASSKDIAEQKLLELDDKWGQKYPLALKSWHQNWEHISQYFQYDTNIRKLIYTTNPIEGYHRQVRKYTKSKGAFTSENALLKLVFCAIKNITKKWQAQPLQNWALAISQLDIAFPNRLQLNMVAN